MPEKSEQDVLTSTLAAIPTPPGANMIQFPALLPGMPAPPPIPALPGMEKIPPPPGVKVVDAATGKLVIAGPEIGEAIPKTEAAQIPSEAQKEKLAEEEIERLLEKEEESLEPIEISEEEEAEELELGVGDISLLMDEELVM